MFQKNLFITEIDRVSEIYTHTIILPARNAFDKMMFMPEQNSHYGIWTQTNIHV